MSKRRKISKEERAERDRLMTCVKWSTVMCLRRMIEAGWPNSRIVDVYDPMSRDIGQMVVSHANDPDWLTCLNCNDISGMVFCTYELERING